jgi:hypothetical protein
MSPNHDTNPATGALVEARHQRVDDHAALFGIIDLANELDLPLEEITDLAQARAVGALIDAALGSLRAAAALTRADDV